MKKKRIVLGVIVVVLVIGAIGVKVAYDRINTNLMKLAEIEIADIDLSATQDGTYEGSYGSFPVSAKVKLVIKDHTVVSIDLLEHNNGQGKEAEIIPSLVVQAQSLNIDQVSGATYSSKVILKAIENALEQSIK